jgi:hypothetical protein
MRTVSSQLSASVDAGVSRVHYDGFLPSAAASLTPSARWDGRHGFVSVRGTYLRFESGNRSLDGSFTGAWLVPLTRRWRGEIAVSGGASDYARITRFSHAVGEGRLHVIDGRYGAWAGATAGSASFGDGPRRVAVITIGGWGLRRSVMVFATADRSFIGDTAYSDVRSSARFQRGPLIVEGTVGARVWSRGGGRGVYGEMSVTHGLGRSGRTSMVLSGGRYPTDVISGSIAGRFLSAAIRIGTAPARPAGLARAPAREAAAPARVELLDADETSARLLVHARGAVTVEIAADFTQWNPVPLTRTPRGAWQVPARVARGIHRINIRIDGGAWIAPAGTTRVADDYDGEVGVLVVP